MSITINLLEVKKQLIEKDKLDDSRALTTLLLRILNTINPDTSKVLTQKEIKTLTEFLLLPERYKYQRFSRYAKPVVSKSLLHYYNGKVSIGNLNSVIYELILKKYLGRDEDNVVYISKWLLALHSKLLESIDKKVTICL